MTFTYESAFPAEAGVTRREPSDVLELDGRYHVWYTRVPGDDPHYPAAYGGEVYHATSPDGHEWTEQGRAVPAGGPDEFDSKGAFTSNAAVADGRVWVFYTATEAPFSSEFEDASETAIGVAVADDPSGPFEKLGPVLDTGADGTWDDFRVDDACPVFRDGECWLYYKGVRKFADNWYEYTPHGVAVADGPAGPYERRVENPVYAPGHADPLWTGDGGVYALAQDDGLWFAPDGVDFERRERFDETPWAPGVFVEDGDVPWGLCQRDTEVEGERTLTIDRFEWAG